MANIKSAKKRIKVIDKKTEQNKARRTRLKNVVKKAEEAFVSGDKDAAQKKFDEAEKVIRMTASKGTIHKNKASRKVSQLKKKLNSME